jgi:hypothetical protein
MTITITAFRVAVVDVGVAPALPNSSPSGPYDEK